MIKSVIQSIPTYVMSCFELPKQLCWDIQQLMARFWWGVKRDEKKIHWLDWNKLCAPKSEGGMGFRILNLFNLSLLAKQGWRFLQYPDSLVTQIFKARYFPNTSFLNAVAMPAISFIWRSILAGRDILSKGLRYQIGMGTKVSLWSDPWLPLPFSFKPFSSPMEGTEAWVVGDLIDKESGEWLTTVIHDLFSTEEAHLILKIPLSLRNTEDRLIWHYDSKGVFSVKSGYHVAFSMERMASQASSSGGPRNDLWIKIWKLCIPPKVRLFVWRLLRGILPTKVALAKKFPLPNVECVFCGNHAESDTHLFMRCVALKCFWEVSNVELTPLVHIRQNTFDWLTTVSNSPHKNQIELLCMCLWVIWSERNNIVWNSNYFDPLHMASWATQTLEEYQRFHPISSKKMQRPHSHWEFPPRGRLKINVDGSWRSDVDQGGIGVAIRDENGRCIAALSWSLAHVSSAIHAEAEACRTGLLIATQQRWDGLILETDCSLLATTLASVGEDFSHIGRIVGDCKELMHSFNSIEIRHIYREADCVAHRLAHIASFSISNCIWFEDTPSIIEDVLFEDCCTRTQGIGFKSPLMYVGYHGS